MVSGILARRPLLIGGGVVAAAGVIGLPLLFARDRDGPPRFGPVGSGRNDILRLPEGFSYTVVDRAGEPLDDGYRVPGRPDGMACFADDEGRWVLLRNHECLPPHTTLGPYRAGQVPPPEAFDPVGMGGVSRVVLDPSDLSVVRSNMVLLGTHRNCAGGPSPWGWLSCEEDVSDGHGWVFVCPVDADTARPPQRIAGYGRYRHEAVAIDPAVNVAYLTEDQGDGCLYRFVPDDPAAPFEGTLHALAVAGRPRLDLGDGLAVGDRFDLEWIALERTDAPTDDLRERAADDGAASIRRGEGIWYHDGRVWICSTTGGPAGRGQVFRLDPSEDTLTLVAQADDATVLDMPDNIAMAPWGDLFMAEDNLGTAHLRVLEPSGRVSDFAANGGRGELAGVCFSPDGSTLFVNLQAEGVTVAVRGPFPA